MRMLVIDRDTDTETLESRLLDGRLGEERRAAALRTLEALNSHADFSRLRAGTVLLIPDSPEFKASGSDPLSLAAIDSLQQALKAGLGAVVARVKAGNEQGAAERGEMTAALKSAAVRRALDAAPELKAQLADLPEALKEEQRQAAEAERTLDAIAGAASAELATLTKLLG